MSALLFALALISAQDPTVANDTMIPEVQAPADQAVAPVPPEVTPVGSTSGPEQALGPASKTATNTEATTVELPFPIGAPTDDYGLVAWCYGALGGYLELHDRVLPEVSRIENAYRRPGTTLADDMSTYDDMQKLSRSNMKLFASAMEAAERASLQPINIAGAVSVKKGRASWAGADALPVRTVAQQWMGWALPVRCTPTATTLEARAKLLGTAFQANEVIPETPAQDSQAGATPESIPATESGAEQVPVIVSP